MPATLLIVTLTCFSYRVRRATLGCLCIGCIAGDGLCTGYTIDEASMPRALHPSSASQMGRRHPDLGLNYLLPVLMHLQCLLLYSVHKCWPCGT